MQILVPLGMNFDAVVVFVTSQTLLFRLALAILWGDRPFPTDFGRNRSRTHCLYRDLNDKKARH